MTVIVTVGVDKIGGGLPVIGENIFLLVALTFIFLPHFIISKSGLSWAQFGLQPSSWRQALRKVGPWAFGILGIWTIGFHLYQTQYLHHKLDCHRYVWTPWPHEFEGKPVGGLTPDKTALWINDENLTLRGPTQGPSQGIIQADCPLPMMVGRDSTSLQDAQIHFRSQNPSHGRIRPLFIRASLKSCPKLLIHFESLDAAAQIHIGSTEIRQLSDPVVLERSWFWLLLVVLTQLIAIAYPEEFFYRGYQDSMYR